MNIKQEISPCYQCELRATNCHAICLKYEVYRMRLNDKNAKLKQSMRDSQALTPELVFKQKNKKIRRKKDAQNRGRYHNEKK